MTTKDYSTKQENMVATSLGWRTVTGSGSRDFHKGDVVSELFLGECKTHVKISGKLIFYKSHWEKITKEAQESLRYPVLFTDNGSQKLNKTWCLYSNIVNSHKEIEKFVESPFSSQVNLNIDIDLLESMYDYFSKQEKDRVVVLIVNFNGTKLRLVPLTTFILLFGE